MNPPLFSVILTTYNRRDLLPRAIQSVMDQTCAEFEFLIIDNGSTDDTHHVVQKIKDDRIKYILNPTPSQSCDAPRNLGINKALGAFISFLDDDDIWYPKKLEKVKKAFDENPNIAAVCHYENQREYGDIKGVFQYGPWKNNVYKKLLYEGNCLSPSAMTIKTAVLQELKGFDLRREFDAAADYDLWIRIAAKGLEVHIIEEPLGEFCITGQNKSVNNPIFDLSVVNVVKTHLLNYEKKSFFNMSKQGMWRVLSLYLVALRGFLKSGDLKHSVKYFFQIVLIFITKPFLVFNLCSKLLKIRS